VITYETSQARLVIDQKWQSDFIPHPSFGMKLGAGWHQLDLFFKDAGEPMVAVNLLWKKPGQEKFEFVSNEFFGKVH
jgi:hypothetical protein